MLYPIESWYQCVCSRNFFSAYDSNWKTAECVMEFMTPALNMVIKMYESCRIREYRNKKEGSGKDLRFPYMEPLAGEGHE